MEMEEKELLIIILYLMVRQQKIITMIYVVIYKFKYLFRYFNLFKSNDGKWFKNILFRLLN